MGEDIIKTIWEMRKLLDELEEVYHESGMACPSEHYAAQFKYEGRRCIEIRDKLINKAKEIGHVSML